MCPPILTDRLELVSMTPDFYRACLRGDMPEAERLLGLSIPEGWPGEMADVLKMRLEQLELDPNVQPWLLRAMTLRGTTAMIGHIGFHTAPGPEYLIPFSPGAVEFGYTVFPAFRRQGYAREASLGLLRWAIELHGIRKFVLSASPDNTPSQRLIAQLGFTRIGSHMDEVDGLEDVFEYRLADHQLM